MTRRTLLATLTGWWAPFAARAQCVTIQLQQRRYRSSGLRLHQGRFFLHTGDIVSTGGSPGFKPFAVHFIAGRYRAPLLGTGGVLQEGDREALLKGRTDIWRDTLPVTRPSGEGKTVYPPGLPPVRVTIRGVVPVKRGNDYVLIDVC